MCSVLLAARETGRTFALALELITSDLLGSVGAFRHATHRRPS
jgi:hypothetical protein